jgi:flagellar hook-length control protein FliK
VALEVAGVSAARPVSDEATVVNPTSFDPDATRVSVAPLPPEADASETTELPLRPPVGAPTVRPSARRRQQPAEEISQELLESTADSLLMVNEPDGGKAFEISIRDDVFDELACRIAIKDGQLIATFRVQDPNLRRLLEAEAPRLRARLEERGLVVQQLLVVEE